MFANFNHGAFTSARERMGKGLGSGKQSESNSNASPLTICMSFKEASIFYSGVAAMN